MKGKTNVQKMPAEHEKTTKCTACDGTGKITVISSDVVFDENLEKWVKVTETPTTINCVSCHGKGFLTSTEKLKAEAFKSMWCKCKEDYGTTFYDDNEHPDLKKHHYRCNKCNKIKQIG